MSNENQTLPTSLEDAMRMVREGDQETSSEVVGSGSLEESSALDTAGESGGTDGAVSGEVSTQGTTQNQLWSGVGGTSQQSNEGNQSDGGSTTVGLGNKSADQIDPVPAFDYAEMQKQYISSATRMAVNAANEAFQQNGITKVSINDLYKRDESGRVSFDNPDDPSHPFNSRQEAQQWIDAINAQIDREWKQVAKHYQDEYLKEMEPAMELIRFGPTFEKMSKAEQDIFDEIIAPYEIKDEAGATIGYSCNLQEAKNVAVNICSKMNQSTPQSQGEVQNQQATASGPALDATTSGSSSSQNGKEEPKNMQDAIRLINESKKQKK